MPINITFATSVHKQAKTSDSNETRVVRETLDAKDAICWEHDARKRRLLEQHNELRVGGRRGEELDQTGGGGSSGQDWALHDGPLAEEERRGWQGQ